MADSTPTGDRTVVVHRHSALTYISLGFNALILLLILLGIACHHGQNREERGEWGGGHFGYHRWADRGDGGRFGHHGFGGMRHDDRGFGDRDGGDMDHHKMMGMDRGMAMGDHHGMGMDKPQGWGGDHMPGPGGPGGIPFGGFGGMDHFKAMTPPNADEMTDRLMLMMDQSLTLTDAESSQIRPLVQGDIAQFQKDMAAQKAAHQKMIDDAKAKIRAVLTPDQQKQFDKMTAGFGTPPSPPPSK